MSVLIRVFAKSSPSHSFETILSPSHIFFFMWRTVRRETATERCETICLCTKFGTFSTSIIIVELLVGMIILKLLCHCNMFSR